MMITFLDGTRREGLACCQTEDQLRVVISGFDDAVELTCRSGQWLSENCEPVSLEFGWQNLAARPRVREEDYICPPELAARLIQLLYEGEEQVVAGGSAA